MKCDFCSEPDVIKVYASPDQVMQTLKDGETRIEHVARGGWCACRECANLIDAADLKGLSNRALELILKRHPALAQHPREWLLAAVEPIHRKFFELRETP